MTIEQPESTAVARASVALAPSGILDPRNQSISGRREDAQDWSISGITRASTGFAVTISSDGDDSLMGSVPNGVNNHLDLPGYAPGWLNLIFEPPKTEGCTSTGRCSVRTLWERPAQPRAARLMDPAW